MPRRTLRAVVAASAFVTLIAGVTPAGASPVGPRIEGRWEDNKWKSPSGNIWCFSPRWGVKCGTLHDGFTVALRRTGPGIRLADGNVFTFPAPVYTLRVGNTWSWDEAGIVCRSLVVGMRCRSTFTGHGFFISRDRYDLW
jgi:hypothetical protein